MHPDLQGALARLRARRGFDARAYVRAKGELLNQYLRQTGISACLVATSGGVDSAVVLGLLCRAAAAAGSPIRRVVAALVPMFGTAGATHQEQATARGREVAAAFGVTPVLIDLTAGLAAVREGVEAGLAQAGGAWAQGQLVSYLRTPALYYLATLLTQEGTPCIVCGTTNRDEGAYIGFFGKASDGMVDLQLISDAHKSEVYAVAELLGVPAAVLMAPPSGDTFDGRTDEEMIGAPYDFVELYGLYLALPGEERERLRRGLGAEAERQFAAWAARLEAHHARNLHKYLAGSPAIHLDVYPRGVPGGWRDDAVGEGAPARLLGGGPFAAEFTLAPDLAASIAEAAPPAGTAAPLRDFGESAFLLHGVLSAAECDRLREAALEQRWEPVGRNGMRAGFDPERDPVGSYRASAFSEPLARALWGRLAGRVPMVRTVDPDTPTDCDGHLVWRAVGVNPLMRFIVYEPGGLLVPHYDAGLAFDDGRRRTLISLVLFLTDAPDGDDAGGATRLLLDPQRHLPRAERVYADRTAPALPRDVLHRVRPRRGTALILDHRVLHDGELWRGPGRRLLLRTDLIYEWCGPLLPAPPPLPALELPAKLRRDPYYAGACRLLGSVAVAEEAAFFADSGPEDPGPDGRADPAWLTTPVHKIAARLDEAPPDRWLAVLLTTGALCPPHAGHLEMMELAREELERRGAAVLGGYLSPSHDEYVRAKCGPDAPDAAHRLRLCQEAVAGSPWLMVDPWEALHTDCAVNFTDVIARLERYLAVHLRCHRPVRVVYVFGSDNARFALAFLARGRCVCVPRPGHEAPLARYAGHPLIRDNPRIVMAQAGPAPDISSSRLRAAGPPWRPPAGPALVYVRDEGPWAVAHWAEGRDLAVLHAAREAFLRGLLLALERAFGGAAEVRRLDLAGQIERAARLTAGSRVLSLDPCIPGDVDLGVSRCFTACDNVPRPGLVARPGWPPLGDQLRRVPPGAYTLLDDDIASGRTVAAVRAALPPACVVERVVPLCAVDPPRATDLCDCRDFLPGAREGGLVIELPDGGLARAPYLLPYVQPADRISVPPSAALGLSREVWALARDFFRAVTPALTVADAAPAFRALAAYLGFADSLPLEVLCQWHVDRLAGSD